MLTWLGNHAAEVTAICALLFTAYQAYLQREHNRISLRPHLITFTTSLYHDGQGEIKVSLENNGLGPAIIKRYQVLANGVPCKPEDALRSVIKNISAKGTYADLSIGHVFSEKEKLPILVVRFPCANDNDLKAMQGNIEKLDLLVEYTCFYGRKLALDTRLEGKLIEPDPALAKTA